MHLSKNILTELNILAEEAAISAGRHIADAKKRPFEQYEKKSGVSDATSIVTQVDFESQEIILKILEPTLTKYDLGVLAEESEDNSTRLEKDYFWCIDPIDGTWPFVNQETGFMVAISLISKEGKAVLGVAYDPIEEEIFSTNRTQPEKEKSKDKVLTIYFDKSLFRDDRFNYVVQLIQSNCQSLGYKDIETSYLGGAIYHATRVLKQTDAIYLKLPIPTNGGGSIWDFGATAALFEKYEEPFSAFNGNDLFLNDSETTWMNKQGVIFASSPELYTWIKSIF